MKGSRYSLFPIKFVPDTICSRYNMFPIQFVPDTICSRYNLCRYNLCRYKLCRYNLCRYNLYMNRTECSGTGLRYRMPICGCWRRRPRCRYPAMLFRPLKSHLPANKIWKNESLADLKSAGKTFVCILKLWCFVIHLHSNFKDLYKICAATVNWTIPLFPSIPVSLGSPFNILLHLRS